MIPLTAETSTKIVRIDGFELTGGPDGRPLFLDVDLGRALNRTRPRDIRREIAKKTTDPGFGDVARRTRVIPGPHGGTARTIVEYLLTEDQALEIASQSDTDVGTKVLRRLIAVRREYLRMSAPPAVIATPAMDVPLLSGGQVGNSPEMRREMAQFCGMAARASGKKLCTIHGIIRRVCRVPSVYYLNIAVWPTAKELLHKIALGDLLITSNRRALPARAFGQQIPMFDDDDDKH